MGESGNFLLIIAMFAVVYLFMIRPQMTRQKNEKKFAENLKKGDRVILKSGLHGRVLEVVDKNNTIILETTAGKLTFERSSISLELSKTLNTPKEVSTKS